jgi:hypothetical protein
MSQPDDRRDPRDSRRLRRREALAAAGSLGLGGLLGASRLGGGVGFEDQATAAASCVLTPEVTEGP